MTNYRRLKLEGATYFFTLVAYHRINTNIFIDNIDLLKNSIHKVKIKYPFQLIAICVLPDHLHLIMELPKGDSDYSVRIRLIKTYFSKAVVTANPINRSMERAQEKGIWQRRFWEHCIRDEYDLEKHLDYIHYNPVKHGYCSRPLDWPYSTFFNYVKRGRYPSDWAWSGRSQETVAFGE